MKTEEWSGTGNKGMRKEDGEGTREEREEKNTGRGKKGGKWEWHQPLLKGQ